MVCTSNRAPDELYHNGMQRDLFLPFIQLLKRRCTLHSMDSSTDYRCCPTNPLPESFEPLVFFCQTHSSFLFPLMLPRTLFMLAVVFHVDSDAAMSVAEAFFGVGMGTTPRTFIP